METVQKKEIKQEELESIVKNQNLQQQYLTNIGSLEAQKHSLLHELSEVAKQSEEIKNKLEETYGKIQIDLTTGEYTEIEEEE
jgi:predicted  nucleic acid-binding Zn-ribbon protein